MDTWDRDRTTQDSTDIALTLVWVSGGSQKHVVIPFTQGSRGLGRPS